MNKGVAVLAGLLLFLVGYFFAVGVMDVAPDQLPSLFDLVLTDLIILLFSLVSGFTTMWLSDRVNYFSNILLGSILILIASISFFNEGSFWSQLSTVFVFVPCIFLGGFLFKKIG